MKKITRAALLFGLLVLGTAGILIYWNTHLFYLSEKIEDAEKKIQILEDANSVYPWNDLAFYGLGKAFFEVSGQSFGSPKESQTSLAQAVENLRRSIRLNPASPFSHFYLAQALFQQTSVSGMPPELSYIDEYKRAAGLAAPNTQIFYEVGKAFLSLWPELSEKDKSFTLDMVKNILAGKNKERILSLLNVWELNSGDFDVLARLLPSDSAVYSLFADFLGEKSLSLEARQKAMARAEFLEFQKIKADSESAEGEAFSYSWEEAAKQFKNCLDRLRKINLYQDLVSQNLIDRPEFIQFQGSILLNMAKCDLELGKGLAEVKGYLEDFLRLEERIAEVEKLKDWLVERRFIEEKISARFDDLSFLGFQLLLHLKLNHYAEIMDVGRLLQESLVVVPGEKKNDYIRVLLLIGEANEKAGYFYEAHDFYQKALDLDPKNIDTLVKMRQNYEILSNKEKTEETEKKIAEIISGEINLGNFLLEKGRSYSQAVILDGLKARLDLSFQAEGIPPLVAVFLNDRVVWENFAEGGGISLPAESRTGKNVLRITALNRPISLVKLVCRPDPESKIQRINPSH